MAVSPFPFERALDPADVIGRDEETARLVELAVARRMVSLAAPRRYGKTSLLRAAAAVLQRDHGFVVVHVDLLGLAGVEDFAARFGRAWQEATAGSRRLRRQWRDLVGQLSTVGITVLGTGLQITRRDPDGASALGLVHTLLDLPGEASEPVLLVLDEFQALHAAWPGGEGVLRSHLQSPRQNGTVAAVFAGSMPSLLADAFALAGRAFYRQALPMPLGRLTDADVSRAVAARFRATGKDAGSALAPMVRLADGHPQRAMLLAHELWQATEREAGPAELAAALGAVRQAVADEAAAVWESLTANQQAALRQVHATATGQRAGRSAPASSLARARESLRRASVIEEVPPTGGVRRFRLVDPLLGDWLDQRRG